MISNRDERCGKSKSATQRPRPLRACQPGRATALVRLTLAAVCVIFAGCSLTRSGGPTVPIAFSAKPNLAQVVDAVNANSSRVQQIHSDNVKLSAQGIPISMTASIDFERSSHTETPGRFRLSGEAFGSRQLDLGSNDDKYWMWVKKTHPPTVFWGQLDEFYISAAQQFLPVPPSWIAEALGVVTIDPRDVLQNELQQSTPGLVQIRSQIRTPRGNLLRILEVEPQRALIVQQQIYDANRRLLAVADTSDFVYDELQGVSLPRKIAIKLPPAGMSFEFAVDSYTLNQPPSDPLTLWSMPEFTGHQYRNLANPEEMQGLNLMGNAAFDPYANQSVVSEPQRPTTPRAAWLRMPSMSIFR